MPMDITMRPIGHLRTDLPEKFGVPRQSGLVEQLTGRIVFEPAFARQEAFRELEGFSHIWVLWHFSQCADAPWHPTVRPPRLGGNRRVGVFASRAPYRPNGIGLSCVRLVGIERGEGGVQLLVAGIDMVDGTPVLDIKPYIPLTDCRPQATQGYTEQTRTHQLQVQWLPCAQGVLSPQQEQALHGLLQTDPRPGYEEDGEKSYGLAFADKQVTFTVQNGVLTVQKIQ